ncbi:hypothetical protein SOPP22_13830 [Shewanella sp. OPT22]|nr:hypothetical protein SOPP22_13830 [Shewanella sp. OPT22]
MTSQPSQLTNEFKTADIMLFKGDPKHKLNWLIMHLSDSEYTHAALVCENGILADEGLSGLAKHRFYETEDGRPISVMRLTSEHDFSPLMKTAEAFIDAKLPYDKPGLILAGLLLLHKKLTMNWVTQKLVSRILNAISKQIDVTLSHGIDRMTCSQFVSAVYTRSGSEFSLNFVGADLLQATVKEGLLMDSHAFLQQTELPVQLKSSKEEEMNVDQLINDLTEVLQSPKTEPATPLLAETVEAVALFSQSLTQISDSKKAIRTLLEGQEMFITPGDLRRHCVNLIHVADSRVERCDDSL